MKQAKLNKRLLVANNVTDENREALLTSHDLRDYITKLAEQEIDRPTTLKFLARMLEALEYEQQELWGFPKNKYMHRFFSLPGCSCPVLDNLDRLGTGERVYNRSCIIHGTM